MEIHIVVGQRKQRYDGEYGPEALACMTDTDLDQNPSYLSEQVEKYRSSGEFESVVVIRLAVDGEAVMRQLQPRAVTIPAEVLGTVGD